VEQDLSRFDLVISDFDGTICHLDVDWQELRQTFGLSFIEEGWTLEPQAQLEFWSQVTEAELEAIDRSHPNEVVLEALDRVERIVVLTNNSEAAVTAFVRKYLSNRAANSLRTIGRESLGGSKRNREIFTKVLNVDILHHRASSAYLGDSRYELLFANELGLTTFRVDESGVLELFSE
jgi:FMN phosphatase YigB (HAD superfamily)